jgi:hypothetical protein
MMAEIDAATRTIPKRSMVMMNCVLILMVFPFSG